MSGGTKELGHAQGNLDDRIDQWNEGLTFNGGHSTSEKLQRVDERPGGNADLLAAISCAELTGQLAGIDKDQPVGEGGVD